ncbi:MAG: T9SS type A sorting domain-containing protein [Clostridia bacterium]|nr:T9SS type A sorting domain-containing protein [Clostridia bacterium]
MTLFNNISPLSSGVYFLEIKTEKEIYWSTVIKN